MPMPWRIFVPEGGGHAAMAMAPDDGFIRDGAAVKSAVALAGLPDAATAGAEAVKACEALRKGTAACVVVLEIAPKSTGDNSPRCCGARIDPSQGPPDRGLTRLAEDQDAEDACYEF